MSLLRLRGVDKRVTTAEGEALHILHGIDLDLDEGDRVSIVGRSGSGKSTLLNILGLLDAASSGEVTFQGRDVGKLSAPRRDRLRGGSIGFVFQQFNLLPRRTAVENVAMPLLYERGRRFWRRNAIATATLERVGLGHRLNATPDRLSGGEQQRVAIARALVREPRLILADEPTGALDLETGQTVMALLDEITADSGAASVMITHDADVAARADRRLRLVEGRLEGPSHHEQPGDGANGPAGRHLPLPLVGGDPGGDRIADAAGPGAS